MGTDLGLSGQAGWYTYAGGDAPEGAFFGRIDTQKEPSLNATVALPALLSAGRYLVFVKAIDYGGAGAVKVNLGPDSQTLTLTNSDWNGAWTGPASIETAQTVSNIILSFAATVTDPAERALLRKRYVFQGLYITTNASENLSTEGGDRFADYSAGDSLTFATAEGNLLANSSFEVGMGHGWAFTPSVGEKWRDYSLDSLIDSSNAYHGASCLRMRQQGLLLSPVFRITGKTHYSLSFWVRSPEGGGRVLLYPTGKVPPGYPPPIRHAQGFGRSTNWVRVVLTGELSSYPSPFWQFEITANTNTCIDALQLEAGAPTDYQCRPLEIGIAPRPPSNVFFDDEPVIVEALLHNDAAVAATPTVRYEVRDYLNQTVGSGQTNVIVPPGATATNTWVFGSSRRGVFRLIVWTETLPRSLEESAFSVVPRALDASLDSGSAAGISGDGFAWELETLRSLGIVWQRDMSPGGHFLWARIEPEEGNLRWFDERIVPLAQSGFAVMGTLGGGGEAQWPAWADEGGKPSLAKWEQHVEKVVSHYRGLVTHWEIWNEPYWHFTPAFYTEILIRASAVIRRVAPEAKIVLGGGSVEWTTNVIGALGPRPADYVDIIATHLYPRELDPNEDERDERALAFRQSVIDRFGLPLWNTESGSWDQGFYKGPRSQYAPQGEPVAPFADADRFSRGSHLSAEIVVRNFLHSVGNGMSRYFYYTAQAWPSSFGLAAHPTILEYDDTLRPKGVAYAVAASLVRGGVPCGNVSGWTNVYAYLFDQGTQQVFAAWSTDKKPKRLRFADLAPEALDLMGNPSPSPDSTALIGRRPTYIRFPGRTRSEALSALETAALDEVADTQPPFVSMEVWPELETLGDRAEFRWVGIDDVSIPSARHPNAVEFSYLLAPSQTEWSPWSQRTSVRLENLAQGDHVFRLRARDAAGNISDPVARAFRVRQTDEIPPRSATGLRIVP